MDVRVRCICSDGDWGGNKVRGDLVNRCYGGKLPLQVISPDVGVRDLDNDRCFSRESASAAGPTNLQEEV